MRTKFHLTELFRRVLASPHLVGVHLVFGAEGDAGPIATPRVVWVPTADTYSAAVPESIPAIEDGQRVWVQQRLERIAGCELRLYTEGSELESAASVEVLLERVVLALDGDAGPTDAQIHEGRWLLPPECPPGTTGYLLQLRLRVPIYDQQPAAESASTAIITEVA